MCRHGRRPRVVLHEALRLDPLLDVLGHRLGYRFIDPRGGDIEDEIAAMSSGLGGDGAVLIFPEGGNFSARARARGIERLARGGPRTRRRGWAREMEHVAAPRPGGALAAHGRAPERRRRLRRARRASRRASSNLWRLLLEPRTVELRMWVVPAGEVPADRGRADRLAVRMVGTIDRWVDEQEG